MDLHTDGPDNSDPPDYPIGNAEKPVAAAPRRMTAVWATGVVLLVAIAVAWLVVVRRPGTTVGQEPERSGAEAMPPEPAPVLGGTPAEVSVPPLDQSDALVRELVRQLTAHPTVVAWLATDGLIRNLTVSVANAADGITPSRHLRLLHPSEPFAVARAGERLQISPASYERYDRFAAALESIDPEGAARLYATLKPRLEEAYRELGHPDTSVDRAVEAAIVQLLRTPEVDGPIFVQPGSKGIGYVYTDDALEALTGTQKQLLRMGPANLRRVQRSLRSLAGALGIPAARLPSPRTHP